MGFMAGRAIELGVTGATVAANVKRLCGDLAYTELSKRLSHMRAVTFRRSLCVVSKSAHGGSMWTTWRP